MVRPLAVDLYPPDSGGRGVGDIRRNGLPSGGTKERICKIGAKGGGLRRWNARAFRDRRQGFRVGGVDHDPNHNVEG
jgi:hypothetical protein